MNKTAIIILNWNNSKDTLDCLKSLTGNYDIIIIDNGSSIQELELLKQEMPKNIHLILNENNLGFAYGNNQGLNYAITNLKSDYALLLNSDAITSPSFLEPLIAVMSSDNKIAAVQPKILKNENSSILDSAGQIAYKYGSVRDRGIGEKDIGQYANAEEIFGACGAAVLYRLSALEETGFFDEELFCLFEDVDLAWRFRLHGYKIFYEPGSVIYHRRGISGEINKDNKLIRRFYGFRNCLILTLKYYPIFYILLFSPLHIYRLITAFYFKLRYGIKAPFFKIILKSIRQRKIMNKNPLLKQVQNKWII